MCRQSVAEKGKRVRTEEAKGGKVKLNMISFTNAGSKLNFQLSSRLKKEGVPCEGYAVERFAGLYGLHPLGGDIQAWIGSRWGRDAFLFISAAGIAVRYIAPLVKDKFTDSPVLVMDEKGEFIIPLLSGHVGGAVEIARTVAGLTGAVPVITTATDVQKKFAVDVFARTNGLEISDRKIAKSISAAVLEGKDIGFYSSLPVEGSVPEYIKVCSTAEELAQYPFGFAVTEDTLQSCARKVAELSDVKGCPLRPPKRMAQMEKGQEKAGHILLLSYVPTIIIGIGCRRGTTTAQLKAGLLEVMEPLHILPEQIEAIVSIDLKKDEEGLISLAKEYHVPFQTFTAKELSTIESVGTRSVFVERTTGIDNVCERAVRYGCPDGELILPKSVAFGCTYALVKRQKVLIF